jgi:hypothetical protein
LPKFLVYNARTPLLCDIHIKEKGEGIMNEMPVTPTEDQPKKNNTPIIIAVVVVVLLCCCCAVVAGGWFFGDSIVQSLGI